jgi:hypothetical protein
LVRIEPEVLTSRRQIRGFPAGLEKTAMNMPRPSPDGCELISKSSLIFGR